MWFVSIEASRFRQFRDTISVHDLAPGLNIIAGANEEGKSTLLRAVRAALFDRYTSTVASTYRPYGEHVSPKVSLVFEVDGIRYILNKVFSRKRDGLVMLSASNGQRWEGPQAEEFLAELLGFSYAQRGGSKAEHQGLAGILWVEQARAFEQVSLNDQSRRQLHTVFDAEMSELLGGEHGEALHRRVAELRSAYFDKRGKPRGEYRQLQDKITELATALEEARRALQEYETKTDRLEKLQDSLRGFQTDGVVDKAREKLLEAQAGYARVQALEDRISAARVKFTLANADQESARLKWEMRSKLVEERQCAQEVLKEQQKRLAGKESDLDPVVKSVQELKEKIAIARKNRSSIETQLRRVREVEQLDQLRAERERLRTTLQEARAAERAKRDCQAQYDLITVSKEVLAELRTLDRHGALAEERLHAAATRVDYGLRPSVLVHLSGVPIEAEGSVLVTETSALEVDGIGTFKIHPGGEDLHSTRERTGQLAREMQSRLIELGLTGLTEAEQAFSRREILLGETKQHAARLNALAPQGLVELEDRMASVESQYRALQEKLGEVNERPHDPTALERENRRLADDIDRLEVDLAEQEAVSTQLREVLVEARTSLKAAQSRAKDLDQALESARSETPDDSLAADLAEAQCSTLQRQQELSTLERTLAVENPQAVALEVERLGRAFEQVKGEYQRLQTEIRDLSVELNTLGQRGLAEEFAQAQAEHASVQRELAHIEAQAKAIDLLHRTLDDALRSAKEKLAEPVIAKLLPYLRQLIPGTNPSISEDLVLTGIRRQSNAEPFADLSIGTREQLAVLLRLAYADLLTEKGKPVTVILDDALVNSDDERRDRMKGILYQAAKKYQIVVLTCHAKEYRDSGGKFIALAECKAKLCN